MYDEWTKGQGTKGEGRRVEEVKRWRWSEKEAALFNGGLYFLDGIGDKKGDPGLQNKRDEKSRSPRVLWTGYTALQEPVRPTYFLSERARIGGHVEGMLNFKGEFIKKGFLGVGVFPQNCIGTWGELFVRILLIACKEKLITTYLKKLLELKDYCHGHTEPQGTQTTNYTSFLSR